MTLYIIWGLLPAVLLFFAFKNGLKKICKNPKRESTSEYFSQFMFCGICLAVAILMSEWFVADLLNVMRFEFFDTRIASWLLYPAVLLVGGMVQKAFNLDPDKNADIDRKRREGRAALPGR